MFRRRWWWRGSAGDEGEAGAAEDRLRFPEKPAGGLGKRAVGVDKRAVGLRKPTGGLIRRAA
jgi:hypothetical protein